jgi:hypothetical protein
MNRCIICITLCILLVACRREEPTRWDVNADVPLVFGDLGLDDLVTDSLLEVSSDGIYHLVLSENLTDFNLDTIVSIQDTLFHQRFVVPFQGGPFSIPPDFNLISYSTNHEVALNDVQLKEVIASGGTLQYAIKSYVNGHLTCTYSIPGLSLNGVPTLISASTLPASPASPYITEGSIDLTDYRMDLTGNMGNLRNKLFAQINVRTSANAPFNATINGLDSVVVDLRFLSPRIRYARGYFGTYLYELDQVVDFSAGFIMPTGTLNLAAASLDLRIENYIGADAQLSFDEFGAISAQTPIPFALNYPPLFSPIQITRAVDAGGEVWPTEYRFQLNESNSNIHQFISSLPDRIALNGSLLINPLGDVSDGNDFIYTDKTLNTWLDIDVPLRFSANQLSLSDTLSLSNDPFPVQNARLTVRFSNTFPLNAMVNIKLVNESGAFIALLAEGVEVPSGAGFFTPGGILATNHTEHIVLSDATIDHMAVPNRVVIEAQLSTSQYPAYIALRPDMKLSFSASMQGIAEVSYD